ncbi:MAG: redoxin domain-containing protein [Myxococcota bacterium]|nr:redoxin domain-containing protein [Myxococcota bacterium]
MSGVLSLALGGLLATAQTSTPTTSPAIIAELGKPVPDFELKDVDGQVHKLSQYRGKTIVLEWFNPDCPFVKVAHNEGKLAQKAKAHAASGGVWLAINSGAPGRQGHGQERNQKARAEFSIKYPILMDESGHVGRLFDAKKTPHMFVIDAQGVLVYAGALDSTRGAGYKVDRFDDYLSDALKSVADKKPVAVPSTKAWGCSVKYQR